MLRLRDRTLVAPAGEPLIMGIVNASPESFSDGGMYDGVDAQVARAEELAAAGAAIIDVGGESGATGVDPLTADEEIRRVAPLVGRLVGLGLVVSVDTWKPAVARAVLAEGAHLINDVSGLRDAGLAGECAASGAGLVLMHTRAEPKRKEFPHYDDVVGDVVTFLGERMATAIAAGVDVDGIVLDPGPDFAKTPAQTVEVLTHLDAVVALGRPVLLAVSRKDFVGALTLRRPRERDAGTLAAVAEGVDRGASIVRVHDVAAVRDYFTVRSALRGDRLVDPTLMLPIELRKQPPD
ncbi:MAG TPA: dihydropteroate synthase [Ilumatobacteraceae bacterium]|nr:dihydropteroate synthase [Ilumatobacteraceae bacterium]